MDYVITNRHLDRLIVLTGQFTFTDNQKFRRLMTLLDEEKLQSMTLDFTGVTFIDSAGLGMLLLLRDECQKRQVALSLFGAQGQVKKIFLISRFDQLFTAPDALIPGERP